ncbi:MAG: nucleotidyl transferase AbiEii/AbiGii toxin family protein [Hyphomicrobiales bacterium]|nr:nucleotidyl transferase AbiEii/AbiGii toxin family protein [Hyphomicrobiales bacterium]
MNKRFAPRTDILPVAQKNLWAELVNLPSDFILYGGTALALQLGHRISEDFDFFVGREIDTVKVYRSLPFLRNTTIIQQEPNTLTCIVDRGGPVKV